MVKFCPAKTILGDYGKVKDSSADEGTDKNKGTGTDNPEKD